MRVVLFTYFNHIIYKIEFFLCVLLYLCVIDYLIFIVFFVFSVEKMSGSTASNSNVNINGPLTLYVVDAQTSAENGRKFTKYKVSVNYNGREWEIWRRFKEFNALNEKVRKWFSFFFVCVLNDQISYLFLATSSSFGSKIIRSSSFRRFFRA